MFGGSKIVGVGSYVPENIVTNFDIEVMMETSDDWIQQRSGIKERRWVNENVSTSDLALKASEEAIANACLKKEEIDMIVFATLSPDHDFPGTGCFLQAKLGLSGTTVLDIRQQCTGFIYGMSIADKFIRSGTHKNVLVVGAEVHSKGLDKSPRGRAVSVLFGDGAGAIVMQGCEFKKPKTDVGIIGTDLYADGAFAKELWVPAPGTGLGPERFSSNMIDQGAHFPYMNGKTVFVHAVKRMAECLMGTIQKNGFQIEDVELFLFHQANMRINSKVAEALGIPEEKVFNTIQKYGNTTAATIPLGMGEALKEGVLRPGMLVASAAFGSGFTWASALYRF